MTESNKNHRYSDLTGQPSLAQQQRSQRQRIVVSLVSTFVFAVVVTLAAMVVGHYNLVATCELTQAAYGRQATQLRRLIDSNAQTAKITTDDVATDDAAVVNDFQSSYKQAKEMLDNRVDGQCASGERNAALNQTISQLEQAVAKMNDLAASIGSGASQVTTANQNKQLADAKSALKSTILSVESLSQNRNLSASTRTQLNQAAATAGGILESDNLSNIVSARKQMDDIVKQVNDALSSTNESLLEIEQKVSAVTNQADGSGSYVTSAVNILNTAGLQEVWGLSNMRGACSITDEQAASWIAAFCSATPSKVYINSQLPLSTTNDVYFADAMRHEIGHYLIYRRCGTSEPASIGSQANAESTASSYAVLYLGANANTLNRAGDERYHMNQASDEAAARIHAGQCY